MARRPYWLLGWRTSQNADLLYSFRAALSAEQGLPFFDLFLFIRVIKEGEWPLYGDLELLLLCC
jgi:hypothetical protein